MPKRTLASLILVVMMTTVAASAETLEKAEAAYWRGDYALALRLMQPIADQGDIQAQYLIGFMYEKGQGVAQDYSEAAKWYILASEGGHSYAQNNLGVFYKYGRGIAKDLVQAYKWFDLAASGSLEAEEANRDRAVANKESIAADMTPEQIRTAQKLVQEKLSSESGFSYRPPRVR